MEIAVPKLSFDPSKSTSLRLSRIPVQAGMRKAFVIFDEEFSDGRNLVEIAKNWGQSGGSVLAFLTRFLAPEKKGVLA